MKQWIQTWMSRNVGFVGNTSETLKISTQPWLIKVLGVLHYDFDNSTVVMKGTKIKWSCDDSEYDGASTIVEGNSNDVSHSKWFQILAQFVPRRLIKLLSFFLFQVSLAALSKKKKIVTVFFFFFSFSLVCLYIYIYINYSDFKIVYSWLCFSFTYSTSILQ